MAGTGEFGYNGDGIPATDAQLTAGFGVLVDGSGNLFISEDGNARVRRVDGATGIITTVVGNGSPGFSGDGGPATSAQLRAVTLDAAGNLFISDYDNSRIRRVDAATGIISTIAGVGGFSFGGDGGPATSANLRTCQRTVGWRRPRHPNRICSSCATDLRVDLRAAALFAVSPDSPGKGNCRPNSQPVG